MPIVIRPAERSDCDGLLAMIRNHAVFERSEATISRQSLLSIVIGENPRAHIFVASRQNLMLGYSSLTIDYSLWRGHTWAHLDCLYVEPHARSQGIGAHLLNNAVAVSRKLGADKLEWQTPAWNERAISFYLREGACKRTKERFSLSL